MAENFGQEVLNSLRQEARGAPGQHPLRVLDTREGHGPREQINAASGMLKSTGKIYTAGQFRAKKSILRKEIKSRKKIALYWWNF